MKGPQGRLTFYYPLPTDSIRRCDGDGSGRRTRPDLANRQMKHGGGGWREVSFAPRQQGGIVGQLAGTDLPRCDPAQGGMRLRQLLALAVLAAGQLDAGPDAVFLAVLHRILRAQPLLRQRAAPQALQPRFGGRLLVSARRGGAVAAVVIGVAEPHLRVDRAWMPHLSASFVPKRMRNRIQTDAGLAREELQKRITPGERIRLCSIRIWPDTHGEPRIGRGGDPGTAGSARLVSGRLRLGDRREHHGPELPRTRRPQAAQRHSSEGRERTWPAAGHLLAARGGR